MAMNVTDEQIKNILKHYHRPVYREVTDYTQALNTLEEITINNKTIYKFTVPFQYIYLDSNGYAVTYKEQTVQDNNVYYKDSTDDYMEYINKYEWLKPPFPSEQYWDD